MSETADDSWMAANAPFAQQVPGTLVTDLRAEIAALKAKADALASALEAAVAEQHAMRLTKHHAPFADCPDEPCPRYRAALAAYRGTS